MECEWNVNGMWMNLKGLSLSMGNSAMISIGN